MDRNSSRRLRQLWNEPAWVRLARSTRDRWEGDAARESEQRPDRGSNIFCIIGSPPPSVGEGIHLILGGGVSNDYTDEGHGFTIFIAM